MKFLADENINNSRLISGLRLHLPDIDLLRVQDTEAFEEEDDVVFAVSIATGRILLTHDIKTMQAQINAHLEAGIDFPGVIFISQSLSVRIVIEQINYILEVGTEDDFWNSYEHLPLWRDEL